MQIPENWTFNNSNVVANFDKHVIEQLPWYPLATNMVAHLVRAYLPENGTLIDFGCSTGNITRVTSDTIIARKAKAISIDNSQEMARAFKGVGKLVIDNMETCKIPRFDVAICFLSIMFMKVDSRKKFINSLINACRTGGVIIVVDKFQLFDGYLSTTISRLTLSNKIAAGCSCDDIVQKELSISGVQRPMKTEDLIHFTKWLQVGEFAGYIFEKT